MDGIAHLLELQLNHLWELWMVLILELMWSKQLEDDLGQSAMKEEDEVDINHEEERIRKKIEGIMREYGLS